MTDDDDGIRRNSTAAIFRRMSAADAARSVPRIIYLSGHIGIFLRSLAGSDLVLDDR